VINVMHIEQLPGAPLELVDAENTFMSHGGGGAPRSPLCGIRVQCGRQQSQARDEFQ
jgi:hypothetical protein